MIRIAFTAERFTPDHIAKIKLLLEEGGCDFMHLRYPGLSDGEIVGIVREIPLPLRRRITLHSAFDQAQELGVGGIHLNRRSPHAPNHWEGRLSRSCHSVDEINGLDIRFDYVTLSPVFASISKPGYGSNELELLHSRRLIRGDAPKVVALGGITPGRIATAVDCGFDGYAVLGALQWNQPIEKFKQNIRLCFNS